MKLINLLNLDQVKLSDEDKEILSKDINIKTSIILECINNVMKVQPYTVGCYGGGFLNNVPAQANSISSNYKTVLSYFAEVKSIMSSYVLDTTTHQAIMTYARCTISNVGNIDKNIINEIFNELTKESTATPMDV